MSSITPLYPHFILLTFYRPADSVFSGYLLPRGFFSGVGVDRVTTNCAEVTNKCMKDILDGYGKGNLTEVVSALEKAFDGYFLNSLPLRSFAYFRCMIGLFGLLLCIISYSLLFHCFAF